MIRVQLNTAAFQVQQIACLFKKNIYLEDTMPGLRSRRETIRAGKDWSKGQYAEDKKNKKSKKK